MSVLHVHAQCLQKPQGGIRFPGTEAKMVASRFRSGMNQTWSSLGEKPMLSTSESSPQLQMNLLSLCTMLLLVLLPPVAVF